MRYGMVSSPVLGADLVRHPSGADVARVLRHALSADARTVEQMAAVADVAAVPALRLPPLAGPAPGSSWRALVPVLLTAGELGQANRLMARGLLGDLDAVLAFVHEQVLGDSWGALGPLHPVEALPLQLPATVRETAARLVTAAVTEAWTSAASPGGAFRRWEQIANERKPVEVDVGPGGPLAATAIHRLRLLTSDDGARLAETAGGLGRRGAGLSWAEDMHEASWSLHANGRTEAAACLQLDAAAAASSSAVGPSDLAGGAWLVLSGCLHLVAAEGAAALTHPLARTWHDALGEPLGATTA